MQAKRPTLLQRTEAWLRETLADGPLAAAVVIERAEATGWIATKTLRRAKANIGVISRKSRDAMGGWSWELPKD